MLSPNVHVYMGGGWDVRNLQRGTVIDIWYFFLLSTSFPCTRSRPFATTAFAWRRKILQQFLSLCLHDLCWDSEVAYQLKRSATIFHYHRVRSGHLSFLNSSYTTVIVRPLVTSTQIICRFVDIKIFHDVVSGQQYNVSNEYLVWTIPVIQFIPANIKRLQVR